MATNCNRVVSAGVVGLCAVALLVVQGCASRRAVGMPSEWQAEPRAGAATRSYQPPPSVPAPTSQPGVATGPILSPAPEIRERNLPSGPEKAPEGRASQDESTPQHLASMHLVDQARNSLAQGKPDAAIPPLEQAIQVDVNNGEAFLLLARAWRMKGSRNKALEFARKAEILFQDNRLKLKEVYLLEAGIYKDMGDPGKADIYNKKASKL